MTTIAYRDGVLASDSQATINAVASGTATKIARRGRVLLAGTGDASLSQRCRVKTGLLH